MGPFQSENALLVSQEYYCDQEYAKVCSCHYFAGNNLGKFLNDNTERYFKHNILANIWLDSIV